MRPSRWHRRLCYMRVTRIRFAGGFLRLRRSGPGGDGVQHLGRDYVAITNKGRMYFIPYRALRQVWGRRQRTRHPTVNVLLRARVRRWVDPSIDPTAPDVILWNTFITRRGREYRGAILRVQRRRGIQLRLSRQKHIWLRWNQLGAATEIQE